MPETKKQATDSPVLPNFLIVGAGKCGTTTLYYLLKEHPDIFLSPVKEPCFFSGQVLQLPQKGVGDSRKYFARTLEEYQHLFKGWTFQKAIGEASADTLYYHHQTIPLIKKLLGDPRIIIILRNPVDRAYSSYMHLIRDGREYLSFEEGLAQEPERIGNNWQLMWYYCQRGLYYEQVKAFKEAFSHVHVVLTDHLKKEPQLTLKKIYQFLEVDDRFKAPRTGKQYNVSGMPRFKVINKFFLMKNPIQRILRRVGIFFLTEDRYCEFRDAFRAKFYKKVAIKEETRRELQQFFKEDILKLQGLLEIDLRHWLEENKGNNK